MLGGGTGAFTHQHGLGVDSASFYVSMTPIDSLYISDAVQHEVVTTDGVVRIANRCQNADLFWALRGGGGAFGVVTRVWIKTHASLKATTSIFGELVADTPETYEKLIRTFIDLLPGLHAQNITGEWATWFPTFVRHLYHRWPL